jgi:acyl transferase domain-containing protein/acyl carrier protein
VHLVLEEAPRAQPSESRPGHHLLVLSARSETALQAAASNLAEHLTLFPEAEPGDVAYTLQVGRRAMDTRCAVVYREVRDLVASLAESDGDRIVTAPGPPRERSVAFMFSGQGAQYVNMGRDLYDVEPGFRGPLDTCAELLEPRIAVDLRTLLYPAADDVHAAQAALTQTAITQPALFAVEYALAQLWASWGIQPDAMIGHSIGELVAACLAGVFSLEDGLALVAERGRLMQAVPQGSMVAVQLPESELRAILPAELDLAAANEARLSVASGPTSDVEAFEAGLEVAQIPFQRLHTSHAFHSRMMDGVVDAFAHAVGRLPLAAPRIPFVSNVTGRWITPAQATSPAYWARQLREPVRFADGLRPLLANPDSILLEVGPGQTLTSLARRHAARQDAHVVAATLRRPQESRPDHAVALESLGRLWAAGVPVEWSGVHSGRSRRRLHLPLYPFERRRYWADAEEAGPAGQLVLKEPEIADWFYAPEWEYALDLAPLASVTEPARWLLFDEGGGLGDAVANRLLSTGHDVTIVRAGSAFESSEHATFTVDPLDRAHYEALFDRLAEEDRLPQNVLHLWSVGDASPRLDQLEVFEHWRDRGFHSLLYLVQALLAKNASSPVQIVAASTGLQAVTGDELVAPAKALLLGVCRSVPQEYPHLACRSVDVEVHADGGLDDTAAQLVAEFADEELRSTVAYRDGQRWLQTYGPLGIDEAPTAFSALRWRGVYLITGGLGRIGLALADELARRVHARLVLVGRSRLPERADWDGWLAGHDLDDPVAATIRRIRELEDQGAEVLVQHADVADLEQMRAVLDATYERFERLDGVVHGAGNVTADGFFAIDEADAERCELQFRSKVQGLIVLEAVLRDRPLDWVVLLSSISSVLAGLGYVAYGAGNAFMDAFAQMHSGDAGVPWISVDWDTWEFPSGDGRYPDPAQLSMDPEEGVEAFRLIVSSVTLPQVIVSTGYLPDRIHQWIDLRSLRAGIEEKERQAERFHSRPELGTAHVPPRTPLEESIAQVWEEVLGLRPVGAVDDFFTDLGGDSLLAAQLISRLRARFDVEIPLRRFFDGPTVVELAEVIAARPERELVAGER